MSPEGILIAFFLFTLAGVSAAGYALVLKPREAAPAAEAAAPLVLSQPDLPAAQAAVLDVFRRIGELVPRGLAQRGNIRRLLLSAGFRWPSAVSTFLGIKAAAAIALGIGGAWAALTFGDGGANLFLPSLCGLGFGFLLPDRILERMARNRGARMRRALPAALDLMTLAIEAGQSLDTAILETSRGLRHSHPDLAAEFTQLQLELRAEASRVDALRNFASRTGDGELRKFAALLMDTDRFGSTLGPALRTHTHYLRTRFRQSAQERARKVAVKLIFPVFFLIFPSVVLVTLGPAAILLMTQMRSLLGQ
jgi:tight adherence protein C